MTLQAVKGGWINTDFEKEYPMDTHMITTERKSKYKHKITVPRTWAIGNTSETSMREWCELTFGPGGRKERWRFGWVDSDSTFYFRSSKDAMLFTLRWSS